MNTFVIKVNSWIQTYISRRSLVLFRIAFASIWLCYDLIDLFTGQMAKNFFIIGIPVDPRIINLSQIFCILFGIGLLIGWRARFFAFGAFLARGIPSALFTVNDLLYYSVVCLLLSQCDCEKSKDNRPALAWPRDLLVAQTAWIYFASALLKTNPSFLSGGVLYARGNYVARVLPFPYPEFYLHWIANLKFDALLSWVGVGSEYLVSFTLLAWLLFKDRRKILRPLLIALVLAIHLYAAYAMNVFFFGASMIAQVLISTMPVDEIRD